MACHSPSEAAARLLSGWVKKCDELHGSKCHVLTPIAERPPQHVPDWVIDTERGCIVPGRSVDKYAALSYVWSSPVASGEGEDEGPPAPDRLLLRRENLRDLQTPGYLSTDDMTRTLPRVILDSMALTSQSGTRYLWVDCLCVVQHDQSTSGKMDMLPEIYSGAFFTIIAASKDNGLHGSVSEAGAGAETMSVNSLHGELLASHWATRGWTFQEHVLSKRSIIFLEAKMFWDCQCSVWWDGHETDQKQDSCPDPQAEVCALAPWGQPQEKRNAGRSHGEDRDLYQQLTSLSAPDMSLYRELVCRYNHRNLTYGQDALRAFSGVLDVFARGFYGGFVSGLPTMFLDSVLLWQPLRKAKRRIATPNVRGVAPPSPLPSWSWAGWRCLIDPGSLEGCLDYMVDLCPGDSTARHPGTWTTSHLDVEWQAMKSKDDITQGVMDGPALLEHHKKFQAGGHDSSLPDGWYPRAGLEIQPLRRSRIVADERRSLVFYSRAQATWFSYVPQDDGPLYRYPLPMRAASSPSRDAGPGDVPFLSCVTTTAELRVRRVLFPHLIHPPSQEAALSVSVFDTDVYQRAPGGGACCPVVVLEDGQGRWAGLMRVMDDESAAELLHPNIRIRAVAVSRGSCSRLEANLTYEAGADRGGTCICGASNRAVGGGNGFVSLPGFGKGSRYSWVYFRSVPDKNSRSYQDKGPIHPPEGCRIEDGQDENPLSVPEGWREQAYEFYNVLWVEEREGVMYRKAAGRVAKDIWERNCGVKERIVLG